MLAVIILTFNEAVHLDRAISSIKPIAREIVVVDSYSTDGTVEIARGHGALVLQHPFVNQAKQFQWALDNAPITADWVMRLDADEIIEPDLAVSLSSKLGNQPSDVNGIILNRKTIFLDRWIRHGGRYPLLLLRIWRRGKATIEDRWMDEHIVLSEGRAVKISGGFSDYNLNNLTFFIEKHNKYATREAIEIINRRRGLFEARPSNSKKMASRQAAIKRFIKEKIYNRIPYEIAALGYFFHRYVLQLGFLDGREGLVYHFLQGLWYRFLVGAKVRQYELALSNCDDVQVVRRELSHLTGIELDGD